MNNANFEGVITKKHHYWRNLVLVLAIFLMLLGVWYYWYSGEGMQEENDSKIIDELCSQFESNESEISCGEAALIALAEYNGEVYSISKTTLYGLKEEWDGRDIWLIRIVLEENITDPVNFPRVEEVGTVNIAVDSYNRESVMTSYGPPK